MEIKPGIIRNTDEIELLDGEVLLVDIELIVGIVMVVQFYLSECEHSLASGSQNGV